MPSEIEKLPWKESIYRQREELAGILREPLAALANRCIPAWGAREPLNAVLADAYGSIPYSKALYVMDPHAVQVSDNIGANGIIPGHYQRNRSSRPYMKEAMPIWGFLLSDAYIGLLTNQPSLTALQVIADQNGIIGYLGADFYLRSLPVTSALYQEPEHWRQVKGDPAIRDHLFVQSRVESPMDRNMSQALPILEEMLTERGVFHLQIHFSSCQAIIWTLEDPLRYRILDHEALMDPDICLVYPAHRYPIDTVIPATAISPILSAMKTLRSIDNHIYLRSASINLYNGMVSLTFSCDGTHYMHYDEFLSKGTSFW